MVMEIKRLFSRCCRSRPISGLFSRFIGFWGRVNLWRRR
ncbi:hypothetical protein LTSEMON_6266 [Salmonella enterica subsp. enterica serovar Montevideo str. S5-403]|uniref:Uncharacterized protein n=1 Tax=Salmonella enterica subsp. enterica serovar Montevideo str. S5-403 TaxID=913242 RepID=G5QCC4_SALMO|nr:hypothetical protein LTSEMON_6266 [Salmonella enterica subsp. enterica serovar Montevideo str. S5-403]